MRRAFLLLCWPEALACEQALCLKVFFILYCWSVGKREQQSPLIGIIFRGAKTRINIENKLWSDKERKRNSNLLIKSVNFHKIHPKTTNFCGFVDKEGEGVFLDTFSMNC